VRAPLTAVLLLFEMTRDYRIVLPLMASVGLCAWVVEQLQPRQADSWFSKAANSDQGDMLNKIKIAEVMTLHPMSFRNSMPVLQAAQVLTSGYFHSALVMNSGQLIGILTTQDIERALSSTYFNSRITTLTVEEICTKELLYTFADESLAEALRRMAARDVRQLPVVDRHITSRVLGIVDRQAITTAYSTALTKQAIADKISANKPEPPSIIEPELPLLAESAKAEITTVEAKETSLVLPNLVLKVDPAIVESKNGESKIESKSIEILQPEKI